jgi:hypothetical protein
VLSDSAATRLLWGFALLYICGLEASFTLLLLAPLLLALLLLGWGDRLGRSGAALLLGGVAPLSLLALLREGLALGALGQGGCSYWSYGR